MNGITLPRQDLLGCSIRFVLIIVIVNKILRVVSILIIVLSGWGINRFISDVVYSAHYTLLV